MVTHTKEEKYTKKKNGNITEETEDIKIITHIMVHRDGKINIVDLIRENEIVMIKIKDTIRNQAMIIISKQDQIILTETGIIENDKDKIQKNTMKIEK